MTESFWKRQAPTLPGVWSRPAVQSRMDIGDCCDPTRPVTRPVAYRAVLEGEGAAAIVCKAANSKKRPPELFLNFEQEAFPSCWLPHFSISPTRQFDRIARCEPCKKGFVGKRSENSSTHISREPAGRSSF